MKDIWDQYNSLIILVGLWLVSRKLGRERERLEERVDTLIQQVKAAEAASDDAIAAANEAAQSAQQAANTIVSAVGEASGRARVPGALAVPEVQPSERANWERVNDIWAELKERIEERIKLIPQKGVRAKYSKMTRRTYQDILHALRKDGILRPAMAVRLLALDQMYPVLRFKPKSVTSEAVDKFDDARKIVNATRALPVLPTEDEDPDDSSPTPPAQGQAQLPPDRYRPASAA